MATLNPIGLLILYIALAGAPQPANEVTIRIGASVEIRLQERDGGWWVRSDDSGLSASYKRDRTKLVAREGKDQQEIDLSKYYKLTGEEDFSKSMVIYPQPETELEPVGIMAEEYRILINAGSNEKHEEASIQWNKRN